MVEASRTRTRQNGSHMKLDPVTGNVKSAASTTLPATMTAASVVTQSLVRAMTGAGARAADAGAQVEGAGAQVERGAPVEGRGAPQDAGNQVGVGVRVGAGTQVLSGGSLRNAEAQVLRAARSPVRSAGAQVQDAGMRAQGRGALQETGVLREGARLGDGRGRHHAARDREAEAPDAS